MENLSTHAKSNRKPATALMCVLLVGSSLLALAPAATATISVDDVSPIDGSISTSNPYMGMGANVSGFDAATVGVNASTDWLAGTLDENTIVGSQGSLQLRLMSRDDFEGNGDPDPNAWTWNNYAVQGQINGYLSLYTDVGNGDDQTKLMGVTPFPLNTMTGLYLNASVSVVSSGQYVSAAIIGWWSASPSTSYCAIMFSEDGAGGYWLDFIGNDDNYGYQSGTGFNPQQTINLGSVDNYRILVEDGATGNMTAEYYNATAQTWISLGTVQLDLANFGPYVPFAGTDFGAFDDWAMDFDYIEVGVTIYAASGTYESAPIDTTLGNGAHIRRISLTTLNGQLNGIGAVQWRTASDSSGPWSTYSTAPLNVPVNLISQKWIQFQVTLARNANPSWIDAITFDLDFDVEVGAYYLDDFPASTALDGAHWQPTSAGSGASGGIELRSGAAAASVGATYQAKSWLLSDTHSAKILEEVDFYNGVDLTSSGPGDTNMLLAGFIASDGSTQTGYIGVVRADDGATPYWGVVRDDGTGRHLDYMTTNEMMGNGIIMITLDNGMFHAMVLEPSQSDRGWLDLGTFDWGATPGTAWWRIGDIGSHSGTQEVRVTWAALQMKAMTPVFGAAYTAGNVPIDENENLRAVIAINGPHISVHSVTYRLDTTPPVGTMVLNGGLAYTKTSTVHLTLSASDRWGVSYFAASESLSFPEGWKPMTASSDVTLSPGDGRKVLWVRFMDSSGVISEPINQSVVLDSQNPTGAIYIANRSAYSNTIDVPIDLLAFDANGIESLYLSNDDNVSHATEYDVSSGTPLTALSQTIVWSLTPGDGTKKVYFWVEDVSGRISPSPYNDTILVDTTAPSLTASITNGVVRGSTTYVNTASLRVNVQASDASGVHEVDISETSDFASFESYTGAGTLTYDVPAVSGAKTIYVRAYDVYGLMSQVRQLDFFVDVNAPTGSVDIIYTGQTMSDFLLNVPGCCNETGLAKARGVVLVVSALDNVQVSEVQFSTSLYFPGAVWQPYVAGRYYFELSANDGTDKTVYVRFRDINGNPSQAFFDQIDLDTTPPVGSIIVNSGDDDTIDPLLSLSLEASDNFEGDLQMRLSLTPDFSGATWLPFADSARFDARTTSGQVTVYFQVRDANGWESVTYSDTITVRQATCQELNNCGPVGGAPGFDGAYSALALAAVAAVILVARRRQDQ